MKEIPGVERAKRSFDDYLKRQHKKHTPERQAVLLSSLSFNGHFTADEVLAKLGVINVCRVSRATVFNTLPLLVDSGLLKKVKLPGRDNCYERAQRPHQHLVCTRCGKIKEVNLTAKILAALSSEDVKGMEVSHVDVVINGLCPKCLKKKTI